MKKNGKSRSKSPNWVKNGQTINFHQFYNFLNISKMKDKEPVSYKIKT